MINGRRVLEGVEGVWEFDREGALGSEHFEGSSVFTIVFPLLTKVTSAG